MFMLRKKSKNVSQLKLIPFEYRSDICRECVFGCDNSFRGSDCPYDFFQEHLNVDDGFGFIPSPSD